MTYLQFSYYLSNRDLVAISYRKYNTEEKDEYPTFTLCFSNYYTGGISRRKGIDLISSNETKKSNGTPIYDVFNSLHYRYYEYLQGFSYEPSNNFQDIQYDNYSIDIYDEIYESSESYSEGYDEDGFKFPGLSVMQTFSNSEKVCYTKNISFQKDFKQVKDVIRLNSTLLVETEVSVSVFVHQKNRLIRNFDRVILSISHENLKRNNTQKDVPLDGKCLKKILNIEQIDVLLRREESNIPCNKSLTDEDGYIFSLVLQKVGCIPTFWRQYEEKFEGNKALIGCRSSEDYRKFADEYEKVVKSLDSNNRLYIQPCTQMMVSTTTRDEKGYCFTGSFWTGRRDVSNSTLEFEVHYNEHLYREVKNTKAYTSETLLGQIGGFVGKRGRLKY